MADLYSKVNKTNTAPLNRYIRNTELLNLWWNYTSSDEFPSFIHQVRGQVVFTDVLMEAQEVQTAGAQALNPHNYKCTVKSIFFMCYIDKKIQLIRRLQQIPFP